MILLFQIPILSQMLLCPNVLGGQFDELSFWKLHFSKEGGIVFAQHTNAG